MQLVPDVEWQTVYTWDAGEGPQVRAMVRVAVESRDNEMAQVEETEKRLTWSQKLRVWAKLAAAIELASIRVPSKMQRGSG